MEESSRLQATVVIPCKNRHERLTVALNSALKNENISEIIIVDDGSVPPLSLSNISHKQALSGSFVRLVKNDLTPGAVGARITGLNISANPVVIFLDSDDELLPNAASKLLEAFKDDSVGIAYGNWLVNGKRTNWLQLEGYAFDPILKNLSLTGFSGLAVRKSLVPVTDLLMDLPSWQDDDFILTVAARHHVKFIDFLTAKYSPMPDSIVKNPCRLYEGLEKLLLKWEIPLRDRFGRLGIFFWKLRLARLKFRCEASKIQNSEQVRMRFFKVQYLNVKALIIFIFVRIYFDRTYT
jgi:glycosyltransferase involved in cell wall biosynthesis